MSTPETKPRRTNLPSSFRDPSGHLFVLPDRVIRILNEAGGTNFDTVLQSAAAQKFIREGKVIGFKLLSGDAAAAALAEIGYARGALADSGLTLLEHERAQFPSFPYEWTPAMLSVAAHLTLDLAEALLAEGRGLKDATPYNVLFRGPEPVFIDIMSLESRTPGDPVWLPYAQFCRTFLLPLLCNKYFGVPLSQIFTTRREGLEPEDVYKVCGPLQRLRPPFLYHVSLPTWLASKAEAMGRKLYQSSRRSPEQATFMLRGIFRKLRRGLEQVTPGSRSSRWSDYMERTSNYTSAQLEMKESFVKRFLLEFSPKTVLDIGCNIGHFSRLASKAGSAVVAVDNDPVVVERVWQQAQANKEKILPLVLDLSRPSPAIGWRNRECSSFLERATGGFDAVLMLAVVHHLLVSERVPLAEIVGLAADLTHDLLLVEYVGRHDPMFQRLTRGRGHLHEDYTQEVFEQACRERFELARKEAVPECDRCLYVWRKR